MAQNIKEYINEVREQVSSLIDLTRDITDEEIKEIISRVVGEKSKEKYIGLLEKKEIIDGVFNAMRGLDVLQPLVDNPSVTEIMINGPDDIFIEIDGRVTKHKLTFESNDKLENVIQNIVAKVNRTVNEASPIVDARLQDGSRVNIVLPPIYWRL